MDCLLCNKGISFQLTLKDIFSFREIITPQWQQAVDDYYLNFYVRNPNYLNMLPQDKQLEITNDLTYVRQYCEMPLKIQKAEELCGGEEAMDEVLHSLFNRELDPAYPYLTYQEFLDACGLLEEDLNLDENISI